MAVIRTKTEKKKSTPALRAGKTATSTPKPKKAPAKKAATKAPAVKAAGGKAVAAKVAVTAKNRVAKAKPSPVVTAPGRRAIFIDVENTSSEAALLDVIDHLKIDRRVQRTELAAVGNWRAVGPLVARQLGALGAQLIHSAPARGVRDWSDLWIAVAAGCWLGTAAAGDVLEIVSNDRAFDAVGDAAAARGVIFRRLQHQRGSASAAAQPVEPGEARPSRRSRGGRRRGRRREEGTRPTSGTATAPAPTSHARAQTRPAPARHAPAAPAPAASGGHGEEPHGASHAQMVDVIGRLTNHQEGRWVNIDVLEKALKGEGFSRPPGSARLVTRLRKMKDVEVDAHGRVRIAVATPAAEASAVDAASAGGDA